MREGKTYPEITPGKKPFNSLVVKSALFILGRGFQSLALRDEVVKQEVDSWEESFSVLLEVLPRGPYLLLQKRNGKLRMVGLRSDDADLVISFKTLGSALLIFTGRMSTPQAYAEHRMSVKGDLARAMSLTRCLNQVQFYLFPAFIARRILKRMPVMTWRRFALRLYVYILGIPFGI